MPLPNGIPSHDTYPESLRAWWIAGSSRPACFRWISGVATRRRAGGHRHRRHRTVRPVVPQEVGAGSLAPGHGLGDRKRPDAGPSGLCGEVQRDHGYPGTAAAAQHQRLVRSRLTPWAARRDRRANPALKGHYVLALKGNQAGLEELTWGSCWLQLNCSIGGKRPASKGRTARDQREGRHGRGSVGGTAERIDDPGRSSARFSCGKDSVYVGSSDLLPPDRRTRDLGDALVYAAAISRRRKPWPRQSVYTGVSRIRNTGAWM